MKIWMVGIVLISSLAKADIICRGESELGPVQIDIGNGSVTIRGAALSSPQTYTHLEDEWDGHRTELITARGLAISYEDWYGCIHNAKITANLRSSASPLFSSLEIAQCAGGSTPDKICQVP